MTSRTLQLIGVMVLCGSLTCYFVSTLSVENTPRGSQIEYPEEIDLGTRELGELATARFTIANRGQAELVVNNVRTSCSCTGMERERDGEFDRVHEIRLQPGERVELAMRVSVRGVPAESRAVNTVYFSTNDPNRPECEIRTVIGRVKSGVFLTPDTIVIGTVPVGGTIRRIVEVRDDALEPRAIAKISTGGSDRITVRRLELPTLDPSSGTIPQGRVIGRFEVAVDTGRPGDIDELVTVQIPGREQTPDTLRVIGRVAESIEVTPATVILPRHSSDGSINSARCLCRTIDGRAMDLRVEESPPGIEVKVLKSGESGTSFVDIQYDPKRVGTASFITRTIRLKAMVDQTEKALEIAVVLQSK